MWDSALSMHESNLRKWHNTPDVPWLSAADANLSLHSHVIITMYKTRFITYHSCLRNFKGPKLEQRIQDSGPRPVG